MHRGLVAFPGKTTPCPLPHPNSRAEGYDGTRHPDRSFLRGEVYGGAGWGSTGWTWAHPT